MQQANRIIRPWFWAILFGVISLSAIASPVDTFTFPDETMRIRFNELSKELRCPKCQNQNLADSNSPIAEDLRLEIYDMLKDGKSDREIVDFMVYRYGDFVRYRPDVNPTTYVLWFSPVVLVLFGLGIVIYIIRRKPQAKQQKALSAEQKQKLDSLLKK